MATSLKIREYPSHAVLHGGVVPVAEEGDNTVDQVVDYTAGSTQSAAFNAATKMIGISSDSPFAYKVGANPTATVAMLRIPAGSLVYLSVKAGDKIAAVSSP